MSFPRTPPRSNLTDPFAILAVLSTGFALGVKHAFDADHVVAVSTLMQRTDRGVVPIRIGALWGAGHTFTLLLVCLIVIPLDLVISSQVEAALEAVVGVMLIALGLRLALPNVRPSVNRPAGGYRSFVIGAVHGLAGSAALSVVILATVQSVAVGVLYVAVFGVGSTLGMLLCSGILAVPIRAFGRRAEYIAAGLSVVTGLIVLVDALTTAS